MRLEASRPVGSPLIAYRDHVLRSQEAGFTREQSSNALIIHGTMSKAMEVLSKLNPSNTGEQFTHSPQRPLVLDVNTDIIF